MIGSILLETGVSLSETQTAVNEVATAVGQTWILTVSFLIFFMHAGFAMLESGQVRSKNVANQLTKNLLTWAIGVTVYFLIGVAIANAAAGTGFSAPFQGTATGYIGWLYGAVFAMTAATIAIATPIRKYTVTPIAQVSKFFVSWFATFFERTWPDSSIAKPACMKKIRKDTVRIQV